jgi:glycine cleavage system transcriptional repressor
MRKHLVVTVSGHDRPGIVEHITKLLLEYHGNVEASRMSRLGGEFAILMMVSIPENKFDHLRESVRHLRDEDYKVTTRSTERGFSARFAGWLPYRVEVRGADHEGIVHQFSHYLAERGANIESLDTEVIKAPMSGAPLFTMKAVVVVPPNFSLHDLRLSLETLGDELGVDTAVTPYVR